MQTLLGPDLRIRFEAGIDALHRGLRRFFSAVTYNSTKVGYAKIRQVSGCRIKASGRL